MQHCRLGHAYNIMPSASCSACSRSANRQQNTSSQWALRGGIASWTPPAHEKGAAAHTCAAPAAWHPLQDPPSAVRLGAASFLVPPQQQQASAAQGALGSAVQSAVEGADEAALEATLCALRQLKVQAVALRDEALAAQRAQHALRQGGSSGLAGAAEEQQRRGLRLQQELLGLALRLRQQAGAVPVVLARP